MSGRAPVPTNQTPAVVESVSSPGSQPVFYVYIALSLVGLLGNAFVCTVMLLHRRAFNSSTNKLIVHQSAVDFLASLVFLLRRLLVVNSPLPRDAWGSLYCRLWWSEYPQYSLFVTSTSNLTAISLERYLACCHPVRHRNAFSAARLRAVAAGAWLCGWLPELHLAGIAFRAGDACDLAWPGPGAQAAAGVLIFVHELLAPLAVMTAAYCLIIAELRRRSRARAGVVGSSSSSNREAQQGMLSRANRNVTKTLFVVTVFFALCWIPTDLNYALFNLGLSPNSLETVAYQLTGAVVVVNLCVNPFIYCLTYEKFRRCARATLWGRCAGPRGNLVGTGDESTTTETATSRREPTVQTVA